MKMADSIKVLKIATVILIFSLFNELNAKGKQLNLSDISWKVTRTKRFLGISETLADIRDKATNTIRKVLPEPLQFFIPNNDNSRNTPRDFTGKEWFRAEVHFGQSSSGLDTDKSFFSGPFNLNFINKVKAIFPGTHFCGNGDIAVAGRKDNLGYFNESDNCCKVHDECFDYIESNEYRYGLKNAGLFTRSHCNCDRKFYRCLKKVNSIISNQIGFTFFTVLGPQCFREDFPIIRCRKNLLNRCSSYDLDYDQEKRAQWFDNPIYT